MATIINTPNGSTDGGNSAAGWAVAVSAIVLLGILGVWFFNTQDQAVQGTDTTEQETNNSALIPPTNTFNTTINSTTTINNSTTTEED